MDFIFYATYLSFYHIIFEHTDTLAGWTKDQAMVFVCGGLIVDAIHMVFYSGNLWTFPQTVSKGDLDYYLVRPVSPLFFLCFREIIVNSFVNLIGSFAILAYLLHRSETIQVTVLGVVGFVAMICIGSVIHWAMSVLFILPVFWSQSQSGLSGVFWSIEQFIRYPDRVFRSWTRVVLVTILPFGLIASFPATIFFEGPRWDLLIHFFGVTVALLLVIGFIWKKGLKVYSSASS